MWGQYIAPYAPSVENRAREPSSCSDALETGLLLAPFDCGKVAPADHRVTVTGLRQPRNSARRPPPRGSRWFGKALGARERYEPPGRFSVGWLPRFPNG